jgi:hypothetical protein
MKKLLFVIFGISTLLYAAISLSLPPIESTANKSALTVYAKNVRYSTTNTNPQDTLYTARAAKDTTMVYWLWPYTGLQLVVSAATDTSAVSGKAVYIVGHASLGEFKLARVDSSTFTSLGTQTPITLTPPISECFAIEITSVIGVLKTRILITRFGGK